MLRKVKKIDDNYYCVLDSATTRQEVKMAEPFVRLLPLSGFPGVTIVYCPLLFKRRIVMPHIVHLCRVFIILFH